MGSGLLCCVALCLLGAGCADSGVMQTPKYLIQFKGQQATLRCSPVSGHLSVYWYQQKRDQSPQFLIQYYGGEEREKGNIPDRFSVMLLSDSSSELILSALELGDSGLFLCASSLAQHCVVSSLLCKNICLYSGSDQEGGAASQPGSGPGKSQVFPRLLLLLTSVISLMLTVLAPGPGNAGIMQTPKSQVLKTGQRMTLNCAQDLKHDSMFWYRQDPGLGLRLIYYSYDVNITEKGEVPDGYSVSRLSTDNFSLTLESATPSQTSTYFCASSYSTVLRSCLCSAH